MLLSLLPSKYNKKVSDLLKVVAMGKEDHQLEKCKNCVVVLTASQSVQ